MAVASPATVADVANELVALCRQGKNLDAINALYSPDIVSIEPMGNAEMPATMKGIDAIRGKNQWWLENNEVHSASLEGPYVGENQFATHSSYDVTFKPSGQRMQMTEMALYTVKDGKIVQEQFFYNAAG